MVKFIIDMTKMVKRVNWFVFVLGFILQFGDISCSDCDPLSDPANGVVAIETKPNGMEQALYSCDIGYMLKGNQKRNCVNGEWTGKEPTCEPECPCDVKRQVAEVTIPGIVEPEHDLLTLEEFEAFSMDQTNYGVWEIRDPNTTRSFTRPHFGLTLEIDSVVNDAYGRRVKFDVNRFVPGVPSPNCIDLSGSAMHPVNDYGLGGLAVFRLPIGGDPSNTRLIVLFSSCPTKYVFEIQCFGMHSNVTLATRTCPPERALVVVWVKGERTGMDELSLSQIEQDLYDNTGLNFCQLDNMKSFFILGENQCTASCDQFLIP